MAVGTLLKKSCAVKYRIGTDTKGNDKYTTQTFSGLDESASNDDIISFIEDIMSFNEYGDGSFSCFKDESTVLTKN